MNVLVIPSANIKPGDSLKGTVTLLRLKAGLKIWRAGGYHIMLLCGGICESGQSIPAAQLMRKWILSQPDAPRFEEIVCENYSLDTYGNVAFSLDVLRNNFPESEIRKIGVVTQWLHGLRFIYSLRFGFGYEGQDILHQANNWLPPHKWIIECFLLNLHFMDPKGQSFLPRWNRMRRAQASRSVHELTSAPLD